MQIFISYHMLYYQKTLSHQWKTKHHEYCHKNISIEFSWCSCSLVSLNPVSQIPHNTTHASARKFSNLMRELSVCVLLIAMTIHVAKVIEGVFTLMGLKYDKHRMKTEQVSLPPPCPRTTRRSVLQWAVYLITQGWQLLPWKHTLWVMIVLLVLETCNCSLFSEHGIGLYIGQPADFS